MNLLVNGQAVTGNVSLRPVCQSNVRLPGAEFNLIGDVNGQWEGKGTISGTWTGMVRWCDKDENRSGSFSISLGQGSVIFSGSGSYYNRYIFSPTGKVSASAVSSEPIADSGNFFRETVLSEPAGFGALGPPRKGFKSGVIDIPGVGWGDYLISSTLQMKINETRSVDMGDIAWVVGNRGRTGRLSDCINSDFYVDGAVRETKRTGQSVTVWAKEEGIGRIYKRITCNWIPADGAGERVTAKGIVLVLVGDSAVEDYTGKKIPASPIYGEGPTPDIAKAGIKGRVVMVGTKKPVGNAQISLITGQGGVYSRENWKSKPDNGAFSIQADHMLLSGTYEVMAQWRSADMGTLEDPFTVYKDLWPVKKYLVTITRDSAKKGIINAGDIEMDTVDNIFNKGNGRESIENRTPVMKNSPPEKPVSDAKTVSSGYNPLGDPNLTSPPARSTTDVAAADNLGNDFQDGFSKTKIPDQNSQQAPISQPESYTGSVQNEPGNTLSTSPPGHSPYGYPQSGGSSHGYPRSDNGSTGMSFPCDASQKQSAYLAGFQCGKKARQNNGTMTRDCASVLRTYTNMDAQSRGGSCLFGGFDAGYREGMAQLPGPQSHSTSQTPSKITAELENKAEDNVHIFVEGQDNFGPHNKLGPGQKRAVILNLSPGQTIKFLAGRNGQVLARCNWTTNSGSSDDKVYVRFSGSRALTCTAK